jgi:hypothetical protein
MGSSNKAGPVCATLLAVTLIAIPATSPAQSSSKFQGVVTFQAEGGRSFDYSIRNGVVRVDMNAGNQQTAMIIHPESRMMYMLLPQQRSYMEMKLPDAEELTGSAQHAKPVKTGKSEVVAGHKCEYWTVKEKETQVDVCVARDMGGFQAFSNQSIGSASDGQKAIGDDSFPLKVIMHKDGKDEVGLVATKVEAKQLDPSLFSPPASYTKMGGS